MITVREHHQFTGQGNACSHLLENGKRCGLEPPVHDLDMMGDPNAWPQWPVLPLKRARSQYEFPEVGFMLEQPEGEPKIVYLATIFEVREAMADKSKQVTYPSFDEIYAAGWRID
jgi:hypothetical protein